jgi:hypothetical protein
MRPFSFFIFGLTLACIVTTPAAARRELGRIEVGATAYLVCHGNLLGRENQEYISSEPVPIIVGPKIEAAALETLNGASDTPEPFAGSQFKMYLEANFGAPASGQCHLADSVPAAREMLDFWQGQYGPPANAEPKFVSWSGPAPDVPVRQARRGKAKSRSDQLGAR